MTERYHIAFIRWTERHWIFMRTTDRHSDHMPSIWTECTISQPIWPKNIIFRCRWLEDITFQKTLYSEWRHCICRWLSDTIFWTRALYLQIFWGEIVCFLHLTGITQSPHTTSENTLIWSQLWWRESGRRSVRTDKESVHAEDQRLPHMTSQLLRSRINRVRPFHEFAFCPLSCSDCCSHTHTREHARAHAHVRTCTYSTTQQISHQHNVQTLKDPCETDQLVSSLHISTSESLVLKNEIKPTRSRSQT